MYDHDTYPLSLWSLLLVFFALLPFLIVAGIAEGIVRICRISETGKEKCQGWKGDLL